MNQNGKSSSDSVAIQLAELQESYILKLDQKLSEILNLWLSSKTSNHSKESMHKLYRAVHAVAGTSSILNIPQVSRVCIEIQNILLPMTNGSSDEDQNIALLEDQFKKLDLVFKNRDFNPKPINLNN
ncbi:MAG: chemotaxis protein histidine kinase CheA [Thalassolituus sp.]|jgi:chemotaxis protein histidine kinase CheA